MASDPLDQECFAGSNSAGMADLVSLTSAVDLMPAGLVGLMSFVRLEGLPGA